MSFSLISGLHADEQKNWVFEKVESMWLNYNVILQRWNFGQAGAEPGMKGWDVIYVGSDAKVEKLYAMIEGVATQQKG